MSAASAESNLVGAEIHVTGSHARLAVCCVVERITYDGRLNARSFSVFDIMVGNGWRSDAHPGLEHCWKL